MVCTALDLLKLLRGEEIKKAQKNTEKLIQVTDKLIRSLERNSKYINTMIKILESHRKVLVEFNERLKALTE